jgi:CheY-like chemotaxis protein
MLEKLGYAADVAINGLEALEALDRESYDIVFMDVQMPKMDGLEATRRIRAKRGDADRPTVIGLTANALQGDREICLQAGMDDYLTKPVRLDQIQDALRNYSRGPVKCTD